MKVLVYFYIYGIKFIIKYNVESKDKIFLNNFILKSFLDRGN